MEAEGEVEGEGEAEAEAGRGRENPKQAVCPAQSPTQGLIPCP